jgi:hypothetical protein
MKTLETYFNVFFQRAHTHLKEKLNKQNIENSLKSDWVSRNLQNSNEVARKKMQGKWHKSVIEFVLLLFLL